MKSLLLAASLGHADEVAAPEHLPVRLTPTLSLAATSRNLTLGGNVRWGARTGPFVAVSLGSDWLISGLVSGFLLDDLGSLRFTSSQLVGYSIPLPLDRSPAGAPAWVPRVSVAVGLWETTELDSLIQTFRTEDYGLYLAASTGGQVALTFPWVSIALGLKPFGGAAYVRDDVWVNNQFQFTNTVLDVDVTLDLNVFSKRARQGSL